MACKENARKKARPSSDILQQTRHLDLGNPVVPLKAQETALSVSGDLSGNLAWHGMRMQHMGCTDLDNCVSA